MKAIGYITSFVAVVALGSLLNGFVLSTLWGWFIVTAFTGMPALTLGRAVGVSMVVSYLTYHGSKGKEDDEEYGDWLLKRVSMTVVYCGLTLLIGYIVHAVIS